MCVNCWGTTSGKLRPLAIGPQSHMKASHSPVNIREFSGKWMVTLPSSSSPVIPVRIHLLEHGRRETAKVILKCTMKPATNLIVLRKSSERKRQKYPCLGDGAERIDLSRILRTTLEYCVTRVKAAADRTFFSARDLLRLDSIGPAGGRSLCLFFLPFYTSYKVCSMEYPSYTLLCALEVHWGCISGGERDELYAASVNGQ